MVSQRQGRIGSLRSQRQGFCHPAFLSCHPERSEGSKITGNVGCKVPSATKRGIALPYKELPNSVLSTNSQILRQAQTLRQAQGARNLDCLCEERAFRRMTWQSPRNLIYMRLLRLPCGNGLAKTRENCFAALAKIEVFPQPFVSFDRLRALGIWIVFARNEPSASDVAISYGFIRDCFAALAKTGVLSSRFPLLSS